MLDYELLLGSAGGSAAVARRMLTRFYHGEPPPRGSLAVVLMTIEAALGEGDYNAARIEAHSLKGSCGYVGAHALQAAAYELEKAARRVADDGAPPAGGHGLLDSKVAAPLGRVRAELRKLTEEMEQWLRPSPVDEV